MKCIDRLAKYETIAFDKLIIDIKKGTVKCGRLSHLIKIKKDDKEVKGKEFFK